MKTINNKNYQGWKILQLLVYTPPFGIFDKNLKDCIWNRLFNKTSGADSEGVRGDSVEPHFDSFSWES